MYKSQAVKDAAAAKPDRDYRYFTRCDECGQNQKVRADWIPPVAESRFRMIRQGHYLYFCEPCDSL